MESHMGDP